MKISVVTVCYNAVREIEKTILSVLGQTYKDIEYLVIDGGSSDGTIDVIKKYVDSIDYFVSETDKGIYDAMNKGIIAATGDYIQFLNAGDVYHSNNCLEVFVPQIQSDTIIAYGLVNFVYSIMSKVRHTYPLSEMRNRMPFNHPATFVKVSYHKNHLFDISYKSAGDYDFLYKAYYDNHVPFQHIPIVIADFEAESGMSSSNYILNKKENARVKGIDKSIWGALQLKNDIILYKLRMIIKPFIPDKILEIKKKRRLLKLQ